MTFDPGDHKYNNLSILTVVMSDEIPDKRDDKPYVPVIPKKSDIIDEELDDEDDSESKIIYKMARGNIEELASINKSWYNDPDSPLKYRGMVDKLHENMESIRKANNAMKKTAYAKSKLHGVKEVQGCAAFPSLVHMNWATKSQYFPKQKDGAALYVQTISELLDGSSCKIMVTKELLVVAAAVESRPSNLALAQSKGVFAIVCCNCSTCMTNLRAEAVFTEEVINPLIVSMKKTRDMPAVKEMKKMNDATYKLLTEFTRIVKLMNKDHESVGRINDRIVEGHREVSLLYEVFPRKSGTIREWTSSAIESGGYAEARARELLEVLSSDKKP